MQRAGRQTPGSLVQLNPYDAIISDLGLPGDDGSVLLRLPQAGLGTPC